MKVKTVKYPSKISRVFVGFNSGSRVETKTRFKYGTAHFLEHMIFKGTPTRTCIEINEDFAKLGASVNASTSHSEIIFTLSVLEENLEPALEIFSDMILNANFPEEEFEKERNVVLEEESSYSSSTSYNIFQNVMSTTSDSYLSRPIIGTKDSINSITREDVIKFKERFCDPSQAMIFMSSSLKSKDSKALIEKYFGKASGRVKKPMSFDDIDFLNFGKHFKEEETLDNYNVKVVYPGFKKDDDRIFSAKALCSVLGGGMDSRLMKILREERGLVYGVSAAHMSTDIGGFFFVELECKKESVNEALDVVEAEIKKVSRDFITNDELQKFLIRSKYSMCRVQENPANRVEDAYSSFMFGSRSFEEKYEIVSNLTEKDFLNTAKDIFSNEKYVFVAGKEDI